MDISAEVETVATVLQTTSTFSTVVATTLWLQNAASH